MQRACIESIFQELFDDCVNINNDSGCTEATDRAWREPVHLCFVNSFEEIFV